MASRLGSFTWGAFGAIAVLLAVAIVAPLYTDYRSRAEASDMLVIAEPLQRAVEAHAAASHTLQGSGAGVKMAPAFFYATVLWDGTIVLRNPNSFGQVIVLQPTLKAGSVTWQCAGGPARDVPPQCR